MYMLHYCNNEACLFGYMYICWLENVASEMACIGGSNNFLEGRSYVY